MSQFKKIKGSELMNEFREMTKLRTKVGRYQSKEKSVSILLRELFAAIHPYLWYFFLLYPSPPALHPSATFLLPVVT